MKDFNNKVALITGAGSGIGRALALQLAEEGCNLALVDWNNETLEETKSLLSSKNISVSTHNFDLRDKDRINELPDKIIELHNNIDIIFNNAGLSVVGTVDEVDEDDWNFGMDILLNSVIQMSTVFLPHLRKRPVSAIVNTSSIFGLFSVPKQSIYNVGKFGVKAFTESLALEMEMAESPVEVYCVFPGHIGTNIYHASKFKSFEADDAGAAIFGANASTIEEAADQFKNNAPSSPEYAAKVIIKNIKKKNKRILIGADAHFYDLMSRLFPKYFLKIIWVWPFFRNLFTRNK
uniref:Putative short-chain dehydrogenase/reductase family protein n=1 Tax=uncultured bacterium EIL80E09 TaxID=1768207 RepID=A0A0U2IWK2_9BACT|nr:putative short-chain dehydrogenase/reductase family protein [uncultured bacterium EIL80E09]